MALKERGRKRRKLNILFKQLNNTMPEEMNQKRVISASMYVLLYENKEV